MVREPYDCIIGDARIRAIPLGRVAMVRGSLWRHAYTAMVEAMMNRRKSNAEPEGPSQLNPNAAGIDVGATSHFAAVPADRVEEPVREFAAFTADLYRLADWLEECRVDTVVMESTGVYWIPLFGVLEERGIQVMLVGDAGRPQRHQERAGSQDRRAGTASGCSSCTPTACCREPSGPTGTYGACAAACVSGPCWWSTRPNISSICRRR